MTHFWRAYEVWSQLVFEHRLIADYSASHSNLHTTITLKHCVRSLLTWTTSLLFYDQFCIESCSVWSLNSGHWKRDEIDLTELFKMVRGISNVPLQTFFKLADGSRTRGHRWKLVKEHSRCDARLYIFSVRVVNRWNSLSESAVQVNSVNCFKNQLDKLRTNQMDFFIDE